MSLILYFELNEDVRLVRGASRGAIYNLQSGAVYSIDGQAFEILETLANGCTFEDACHTCKVPIQEVKVYLDLLTSEGIGRWCESPITPCEFEDFPLKGKSPFNLEFIWLELTEGCNLRCLHCYSESSPRSKKLDQMTHEDWLRIITESADLGCRRLQFIGGEPFLYGSRLFELADHAIAMGFDSLEVFTNATMITDWQIQELRCRNMSLAVSLYGQNHSVHNSITLVNSSFNRTVNAIRELQSAGLPVRIAIIAMGINEHIVSQTVQFARETLGISEIGVDVVRPSGRGCNSSLTPSAEFLEQFELRSPSFRPIDREIYEARRRGHNCFSTDVCVTATGEVYPCIMERVHSIGNVLNFSLRHIWEDKIANEFRSMCKDEIEVCKDCEYRYACFDCRPKAVSSSQGNWLAKPSWCHYNPYSGNWNNKS